MTISTPFPESEAAVMAASKSLWRLKISLRAAWLLVAVVLLAALVPAVLLPAAPLWRGLLSAVMLLGLGGWIFLAVRLWAFRKRLIMLFRRIYAGDYGTGIRDISWLHDEVSLLTAEANRACVRLQAYDELRAEATALSFRAMEKVAELSGRAIVIVNLERQTALLNDQVRDLFDYPQESVSIEAIDNRPENGPFMELLRRAVYERKIPTLGRARLRLPAREVCLEVEIDIHPLKGRDEKVKMAIVALTVLPTPST
jgi:PAS domain-containing protein